MPENQKEKKNGTLAEVQKDRGYYYDDAHGYEEYVVADDDNEDDDPDSESESNQADPSA